MIVGINDALKAIAYALLVLFFVIGVMKTCGSFTELKRPEVAFKCFIRFVLAQAAVTYGMELMTALFSIAQGAIQTIMGAPGLSAMEASTLPAEIASTIEGVGLPGEHSALGGDATRFAVHLGAVTRHDSDRLWPLF